MKRIEGPWVIWKQLGAQTGIDKYQLKDFCLVANVAIQVTQNQADVCKRLYGNVIVFEEVWIKEDSDSSKEEQKPTKTQEKPKIPDFTKETKEAEERLRIKAK